MKARSDRTSEQLEGWLKALVLIGAAINRNMPLDELLNMSAKTACKLMAYDFCSVTLPSPDSQVLRVEGSHGLSAEYIQAVNILHPIRLRGASVPSPSSQAFKLGIPIQVEDTATSLSFAPWADAARNQGVKSTIAVPLIAGGVTLGTLNCSTRSVHHFYDDELSLLRLLADQLATAITTARLRSEQARAIASLNSLNETLQQQRELQRQDAEVNDRFTSLALAGGGIAEIGASLADVLAKTVLISSQGETLVCGPAFETARQIDLLKDSVDRDSRGSNPGPLGGPQDVLLSAPDGTTVSAVTAPVAIREEAVAWIWMTGTLAELTPAQRRAIEHAVTIIALELLSVRIAGNRERFSQD